MKVVILAGGYGTRISEESGLRPKPMVEIGGKPVLWHIMKIYSHYGFHDFVICLGYKGFMIKEYFAHYFLHQSDVTFDFRKENHLQIHNQYAEPWKVTLVDTGENSMTGGRVLRVRDYVDNEPFMLTYGDGVSDIDIGKLVDYHQKNQKMVTMSSVQTSGRFGLLQVEDNGQVSGFQEKPRGDGSWINAGYMVCNPQIFDYLENDQTILEREPLEKIAEAGELVAYKHDGFWFAMDTLRDKNQLEKIWDDGKAPWKLWG